MNTTKFVRFNMLALQEKLDGSKLPEAGALAKLVEESIKARDYIDYYENEEPVDEYDVIVIFDIDPLFGIFSKYDGDPIIQYSTPEGIVWKYL